MLQFSTFILELVQFIQTGGVRETFWETGCDELKKGVNRGSLTYIVTNWLQ